MRRGHGSGIAMDVRRGIALLGLTAVAAGLIIAGCSSPKTEVAATTQTVKVASGAPDQMSVHLDRTKSDQVQWSNDSDETIEIVFLHGGPTLQIAPHSQSRAVAVSEFGGRGSFPYHVTRSGAMAAQTGAPDTLGGPGDPDVDVGP